MTCGLSVAGLALAGCVAPVQPTAEATPPPPPQSTLTSTPTPVPSATPSFTPLPSLTPTPDPYDGLTIESLRRRSYGSQGLTVLEQGRIAYGLTRAYFDYESDGLQVHAFLEIPAGEGPFPVVLVLHGYIDPEVYNTLTYTAHYATDFARRGFIAVHPNYRNYPPSESGPSLFRVGYAVDVLNLAVLIRSQAGQPGPFQQAEGQAIGLFGHSMGGGIALRSITVSPEIDAAVLYGAMSGNERWNFEKIQEWSEGQRGIEELAVPEADLGRISPIFYLEGVQAPVSIHHGAADDLVPPEWSEDLCARLTALGKTVECFSYPGQPHTFYGEGDALLVQRAADFFHRYLGPQSP
jgi:dipeptidyl aminopeptidase/acylaminoacyl peptidase